MVFLRLPLGVRADERGSAVLLELLAERGLLDEVRGLSLWDALLVAASVLLAGLAAALRPLAGFLRELAVAGIDF